MSNNRGDSTRDWLLKKLLKMKESLMEQGIELKTVLKSRDSAQEQLTQMGRELWRLSERIEKQNAELAALKRVPPVAPNLEVIYHTQRGNAYSCAIDAVQSANGHTTIHVRWPGINSRRTRDAEEDEFVSFLP